jgi:hypothetical protein
MGAGAGTSSAGASGETTSAVAATAAVPAATFVALFVFHLRAGAAATTVGTTSAGVGAETTPAVAAAFIALFIFHLRTRPGAGAGAPTSAAGAGAFETLNVILLNYPVVPNSCHNLKGQTHFCLSFPPTGAEQPRWGDECPLFGHFYPLRDAFKPDQAQIGKHSLSSR